MSKTQLTDGSPVPADRSHTEIDPKTGMQKGYIVLTPEERAKGFVKPVRRSYVHKKCGVMTTMGTSLAETYARDPYFYSGTFCCCCSAHFDLSEFSWEPDGEPMDPLLQEDWHKERDARVKRERAEYRTRRIAELESELTRLRAEETSSAETVIHELEKPLACDTYKRPQGIMGGPCLNCGRSQPEHANQRRFR